MILRKVERNEVDPNPVFETLSIGSYGRHRRDAAFNSSDSRDYSKLGAAIANNTHLTALSVMLSSDSYGLIIADSGFYEGLKQNSSINELLLWCNYDSIVGGVAHKILQAYQENNSHLSHLQMTNAGLQNGGDRVIVDTLRCCTNLSNIHLSGCNITDEQLLPMVDAIRGYRMLEGLSLGRNRIGNAGGAAIATLLADPNFRIQRLSVANNNIGYEGAVAIINSLSRNKRLQKLYLEDNQFDGSDAEDIFCRILCDTASINSTYMSNHNTLERLSLGDDDLGQRLAAILKLNRGTNKSHVAIRKILKYHPSIDMEPFFEWDMEEEGERNLKALPHIINWFEKADEAVGEDKGDAYNVEERKLSAILQFAKAMPLLFEGIANTKVDKDKKCKRSDG